MIELTRIGQREPFLLNPDLIERVDSHVDSVIRLTNGIEYVVAESAEEIVDRIVEFRSRVFLGGPIFTRQLPDNDDADASATVVELPTNREVPR
jgi:flagellar protein FlbD